MKKISLIYIFVCSIAIGIFSSCGASYNIKGRSDITSLNGEKLYLKAFSSEEMKDLDSCNVTHGQFTFKGMTDTIRLAYVTNDYNMMPVILEEGEISVVLNTVQNKISGTPLNNEFDNFLQRISKVESELNELSHKDSQAIMNGENIDSVRMQLNNEAQLLFVKRDSIITNFICNNFGTALAPAAFQYITINMQQIPELSPWVEEIISKADEDFKNDPYVRFYIEQAKQVQGIMNGTIEVPQVQQTQQPAQQPLPEMPDNAPTPNQLAAPADTTTNK